MYTLTQRHRVGKASNKLLVHADGAGVNAERNLMLSEEHSYIGDFCTCSNVEWVPVVLDPDPAHSVVRCVRQLPEGPQPVCHPREAQIRRKPSITPVKEVKNPKTQTVITKVKERKKQELAIPF